MFNLTPVVKNLLLINVILFFAQKILSGIPLMEYLALWNVRTEYFKPYQLFTYMFAHLEFMHILMNMLGIVFMGPILETFLGQKRFLLLYMVTGIGAAVFNILIDLYLPVGSFGSMMGASGAVYGLLTAFGVIFPNMEMRLLFLPFGIKAKYFVLILGSLAIYSGFMSTPGDNTAHFAHLGGIFVALGILQFWKKDGIYR